MIREADALSFHFSFPEMKKAGKTLGFPSLFYCMSFYFRLLRPQKTL